MEAVKYPQTLGVTVKKKNSTWFYTNSRCDKEIIVAESKHFIDKSSHTIYRLKQSGKIPGD